MEFTETETISRILLKLEKGEDIFDTLTQFAIAQKITNAWIEGIGALMHARIGFFDGEKYLENSFSENLEIVHSAGSIGTDGEDPILHMHIALGKEDGTMIGGHLLPGCIIGVTGEFTIEIRKPPLFRKHDAETGLKLCSFAKK